MDEQRIEVLTVDDAPPIQQLVKLMLELDPGIVVVGQAGNGRVGVEMARDLQPHVVVLDISMPELNGIDALPLILQASPGSAVVMLSGFSSPKVRAQCEERGAYAFIDKGSLATDIVSTVRGAALRA